MNPYDLDKHDYTAQERRVIDTRQYFEEVTPAYTGIFKKRYTIQLSAIYPTLTEALVSERRMGSRCFYGYEFTFPRMLGHNSSSSEFDKWQLAYCAIRDKNGVVWMSTEDNPDVHESIRQIMLAHDVTDMAHSDTGYMTSTGEFLPMYLALERARIALRSAKRSTDRIIRKFAEHILAQHIGMPRGSMQAQSVYNDAGLPINMMARLLEEGPIAVRELSQENVGQMIACGYGVLIAGHLGESMLALRQQAVNLFTRYHCVDTVEDALFLFNGGDMIDLPSRQSRLKAVINNNLKRR